MASTIHPQALHALLSASSPVSVLDVRSAAEFAIGHIPGAINIPMEQVESRRADLPDSPLVVVCEAGKRAEIAASWLADRSQLSVLDGGTRAWRNSGFSVVTCAPCRWTLERQVRLIAGVIVLIGTLLSVLINPKWIYLAMFIGAGLAFAGATNICGMAMLLARMPWNQSRKTETQSTNQVAGNCCN